MDTSEGSEGLDERDDGPGPDDGAESQYRSDDEVRAALGNLDSREIKRLMGLGRIRAIGTELSGEDLFQIVVERLLEEGRRHWRNDETLTQCFARTMTSLTMDWWRRRKRVSIKAVSTLGKADALTVKMAEDDSAGPDRLVMARQELEEIKALLKDNKNTLEVAQLLGEGETPADIRDAYALTQTQYDSALKRIVRARKKVRGTGGKQ